MEMVNSNRTAQSPSSLDFDRLVGRDNKVCRDHLFEKYGMLLKNTVACVEVTKHSSEYGINEENLTVAHHQGFCEDSDLLVDVIRQVTDIKDEDREIVKKLENASYRKFAFRQIKRHVNVCLDDVMEVIAMIDEDFMTLRLQRMGELIKKVMESWDIMLHGIEVIDRNPRICTTLPKEIELFHELSSIDMEEFNISLGQLRGDIASRMSFCQLSSREEFKACLTCSLGQLQLDSLRFDNLSLHGDCERSSGENDENDNENKTLKRKHEEDTKKEDNQLEIKSNAKRMRFCEPENPEGVPAAIRPQIILDSSCSDTFPYDYDPSEGCIIGKSISREDFTSKHKYITAWAECQSETCLNGNPADNASSFSCEDMDLDAMSVDGTSSHDVSKTNFVAIESQLPSRHIEVSAQLGHLNTIQIHNEKQRNELDWPSDNVYCDCLKSRISDRVEQPTQPMNSEECDSNVSLELNCCDKLSSQSDCSTIDYNDMAVATQGCSDEPNKEACRTAGEILAERESNILSGEPNAKQCLKFSRQESNCSLYSELECFDKFSSQSDCSTIDYNDLAIVTQSCNDEPNTEACRISNEILPATQSNKLSDEAISSEGFDVALLERESNLNLQLKCCDKVSSKPDDLVDSKHIARVTQRCNEELKVEACRASNEISPQRKSIKLSDEVEVRKCLKITLVHKGCGIWAVKTSNKRKRSESESDDCIDSMNDAQAILDVGAQHRYRVFKRVKLTLTNDHPSKYVKQGSVCTTRFRSLRRLATSLREMKSRIFRWPFQKRRATVTPFLI